MFGSNLAGRHGKGAALDARQNHGAQLGVGRGLTGQSYALPTKGYRIESLPLRVIGEYVREFLAFAAERPDMRFFTTRIGCGLAGFSDEQVAPLFARRTPNVHLCGKWLQILGELKHPRVFITGFCEPPQPEKVAHPLRKMQEALVAESAEIVCAESGPLAPLIQDWAAKVGLKTLRIRDRPHASGNADIERRNQLMVWYSTRGLVFQDREDSNYRHIQDISRGVMDVSTLWL